jgi:hypothetical protein
MSAACILLVLSAVIGLVLSTLTWWPAIVACEVTLAGLFSMVLQIEGFRTIPGIAIITVCLTVSQVAYLIGLVRRRGSRNNIASKRQQPYLRSSDPSRGLLGIGNGVDAGTDHAGQ